MPCGCVLPMIAEGKYRNFVSIDFDVEHHDFQCRAVWDMIGRGDTKGVFQIESQLGQQLSKRLKPENIEQLGAETAIMRPGPMESKLEDGKSVTDHYIMRKNREEPVTYYHPALEPALKDTYGLLIYQEGAMQIARDIAGFTLVDADMMRKAIGKKLPVEMAKVKVMFLDGCKKLGIVNEEEAHQIFDGIEKSQRYSFNKSHSISYGILAYMTAYAKAHLPEQFFTGYLRHSSSDAKTALEIEELVNNTKLMNIEVRPPDIRKMNKHFKLLDYIYFGLIDIKGIGESSYKDIASAIEKHGDPEKWTKNEFLFKVAPDIGISTAEVLVSCGAMSYLEKNRSLMIYELQKIKDLQDKQIEFIQANLLDKKNTIEIFHALLQTTVGKGQPIASKITYNKIKGLYESLVKPPYSLVDNAAWIAKKEKELLGTSITCSEVDDCDTSMANCTCKDFIDGFVKHPIIAGKLERLKEITIKNGKSIGQKMAFLTVSDSTCVLDSVTIFSEPYSKYKHLLLEGNNIMICGSRDSKRGSFLVDKVWQLF
jgi:DNA polymerase III alpha subunit